MAGCVKEVLEAGMDLSALAGARDRDVCAISGCVLGDDQVGAVGRLSLGGERMLHVGQSHVGLIDLALIEGCVSAVGELNRRSGLAGVDLEDGRGPAVW